MGEISYDPKTTAFWKDVIGLIERVIVLGRNLIIALNKDDLEIKAKYGDKFSIRLFAESLHITFLPADKEGKGRYVTFPIIKILKEEGKNSILLDLPREIENIEEFTRVTIFHLARYKTGKTIDIETRT